jgi:phage terminase large subunit-like protein
MTDRTHKEQLLALLQEKADRKATNKIYEYFPEESDLEHGVYRRELYPKALAFFKAGNNFKQRAIIAANRTGKTLNSHLELAYHATGLYPDWWEGKRFTRPITAWVASVNNESVRDISQTYLLGSKVNPGTGLIPKTSLADKPFTSRAGVPDAVQDIFVKHVTGGISRISLKSYEQGRKAFQGTAIDVICLDEEPDDPSIYTECLTRTMTTNGIVIATFTPLSGLSQTVKSFIPKGKFPEGGKGHRS